MLWNIHQIKQCEHETGQALLSDKQALVFFNQDFGHISKGFAEAVCKPNHLSDLQTILSFASHHKLPVTLRAHGLSQSGQSLAVSGGLTLDIRDLNSEIHREKSLVTSGCSVSWKDILAHTLEDQKIPRVFPYNTNLTLGGVLSVGGVGSSSFKEGILAAHVQALDVVLPGGEMVSCNRDKNHDLFDACLSGTGLFGVIYNATLNLRSCKSHVRIHTLAYDNYQQWMSDQFLLKKHCEFLEAYISPEHINSAQKVCILQFGIEYETTPPSCSFLKELSFTKEVQVEDKTIWDYVIRHDVRLNAMQENGTWNEMHPWYECYVDGQLLLPHLQNINTILDENVGGIYHVFPVAEIHPKYFMLPSSEKTVTFNVLSPGIPQAAIKNAVQALQQVDELLLNLGGKRYISGWFDQTSDEEYWARHYGSKWEERKSAKQKYDPTGILCSQLFPQRFTK
jgi:FAD/FMN-containing dehydrogenase